LNVERRRKRKIVEQGPSEVLIDSISDPLVADLMLKEKKFLKLLTSSVAPIHNNLSEALSIQNSVFDENFKYYESNQLGEDDQMNFSYWYNFLIPIQSRPCISFILGSFLCFFRV
jgi:hypothetical protein